MCRRGLPWQQVIHHMELRSVVLVVFWLGILVAAILGSVSGWHFQRMLDNRRPGAPGSDHYYTLGAYLEADRYTAEGQRHRQEGLKFLLYTIIFVATLVLGLAVVPVLLLRGP